MTFTPHRSQLLRGCRQMMPAAVLATLILPRFAYAQSSCGPGQVAVDLAGHCCSPGQGWNPAAGQCANFAAPTPAPATSTPGQPAPGETQVVATPATTAVTVVTPELSIADPNAPVAVTFAPEQPTDIETLQIQPVGAPATTCNLPCVVNVTPGYITITGSGARNFTTALNVPPSQTLTVQVNHIPPRVPYLVGGGTTLAVGIAGAIVSGYFAFLGFGSNCGAPAMTPEEESAAMMCRSSEQTGQIIGDVGFGLGATAIVIGMLVLLHAPRGDHPITLMNPGDISRRPVSLGSRPGLHFAGIDPVAIPGGGMLQAAIRF